jgi:hypothetical protein
MYFKVKLNNPWKKTTFKFIDKNIQQVNNKNRNKCKYLSNNNNKTNNNKIEIMKVYGYGV